MPKKFSYQFYRNTQEAWEAMYEAILVAEKSILWETYIFTDDEVGKKFVKILCEKSTAGVAVRLIIDAIGSASLSGASIHSLQESGVKLVKHNDPWRPTWNFKKWWRRVWLRSHRKLLIMDDEVAFIGGVNVEKAATSWDDLQMKLTGRILRQLSYRFAKDYLHSGGNKEDILFWLRPKRKVLADLKEKVKFIMHYPVLFGRKSRFKSLYYQGLAIAKESFTLVTPYYAPDLDFIRLIIAAKKRGTKVHIVTPLRPDVWIMKIIGQVFLEASVRAGATVYFLPNMNHAKVMGVDNTLGVVGSANLTDRSLLWNRESGVVFEEEKMVGELNSIVEDWKKQAIVLKEIKAESGGLIRRFLHWIAKIMREYV